MQKTTQALIMLRHPVLIGLMLSCFIVPISSVKADPPAGASNSVKADDPPPGVSLVDVVDRSKDKDTTRQPNAPPPPVRLGESIKVIVNNGDRLQQSRRDHCKEGVLCQEKNIHLFLNMMELKGVRPLMTSDKKELQFRLPYRDELPEYRDNKEQRAVWAALFGFRDKLETKQLIDVSVGLEDGSPLASLNQKVTNLTLVKWSEVGLVFYCVIMAIILIFYGAGFKKGLFSDRGTMGNGTPALSLARVQMGFWFFLVIASFLFIWLVIGELPSISPSVLALIGIASGTTLGAAIIDSSKRASASAIVESESQKQITVKNLEASIEEKLKEREQIETSLKGLSAQDPGSVALIEIKKQQAADLSKTIEQLQGELRTLKAQLPGLEEKSKLAKNQQTAVSKQSSFLDDLFSDENGWSFHRVQMGVWTLVLGFVFIWKVLEYLAMPDFDPTLLALMGISSGTYLGFKLPEQQPVQTKPLT